MTRKQILAVLFVSSISWASSVWGSRILSGGGGGGATFTDFAYQPEVAETALVPLTSAGTTNIATHAGETGTVVGVYFAVAVDIIGNDQIVSGTPDVDLVLTVDGTAYTERIYGSNCPDTITPVCWSVPFFDSQRYPWWQIPTFPAAQIGETVNTKGGFFYNINYKSSIQLDVVVNTISGGTEISMNASLVRNTRIIGSGIARAEAVPRVVQPLSSATFTVDPPVGTVRTTIVNVTEAGMLQGIGFRVGAANLPPSANDCDLELTIDGNLTTQPVYDTASGWPASLQGLFSTNFSFFSSPVNTPPNGLTGGQARDWMQIWYQARYHTSLLVEAVCVSHGGTAGALVTWTVLRSIDN